VSYCRKNGDDSDVYLIATAEDSRGFWSCIGCDLAAPKFFGYCEVKFTEIDNLQEVLAHLEKHRESGHKVPERALERVRKEIAAG
jgi:hypothetical protein